MKLIPAISNSIKRGIRNWLNIVPANPYAIQINEIMDYEISAIRNRIWYRGDSNEIEQMYQQNPEYADKYKFWACRCTPGMEMRKIHTGLPSLIVRILSEIVLADMNDFKFPVAGAGETEESENTNQKKLWEEIAKDNKFSKKMNKVLKDVLVVGDGAFKIVFDTEISEYPIIVWYPGERIEVIQQYDRVHEVIFKSQYKIGGKEYVLNEIYGWGSIKNEVYYDGKQVQDSIILDKIGAKDYEFDDKLMLAVPFKVYESTKFEGRGGSIFDGKLDSFDALDEAWSQWMDALRAGRAKTYIPDCLVPHDPETGKVIRPNPFDNRYFAADNDMSEKAENKVNTDQPSIPHDSYVASYSTALDMCLQGIISPSTLGIDVKKLDNAEAQREKEKATLYSRNAIVEALQETLPELVSVAINAWHQLNEEPLEEVVVEIPFGEYANPSFESQIETLAKARPGTAIMSIEAQVEELYGDSKEQSWKDKEVMRLKEELGIAVDDEMGVNMDAQIDDGVKINGFALGRGVKEDESNSKEPPV